VSSVLDKDQSLRFVLETNGFILGYLPDLISSLKTPRLSIRVALKGWDEQSFEKITGIEKKYFRYPLIGLVRMLEEGMDVWPAVMRDTFGQAGLESLKTKLMDMGVNCDIETEVLEKYPYVMENISKRGVKLV